jgi:2-iminobutanoate/2-iminopropanoate deaminase
MKTVHTDKAPKAIGPYSQAQVSGSLVFCAGQTPMNLTDGNLVGIAIEEQTEQALKNLFAVLVAAGSQPQKVLKTTVFLKNFTDFQRMNAVYERMFEGHKPARSTVEVSRLPKDCLVEIECIAEL